MTLFDKVGKAHTPDRVRMISPAMISPMAEGVKDMLAGAGQPSSPMMLAGMGELLGRLADLKRLAETHAANGAAQDKGGRA